MDQTTVARRFFDRINEGDIAAVVAMLAEDFVGHEERPGLTPGRDGVGELFAMFGAAFPDVRWEPDEILADGDKVAVRVRVTGTNRRRVHGYGGDGQARERPAHRHRADRS
jgi:ketosteroid isomerase-like protein